MAPSRQSPGDPASSSRNTALGAFRPLLVTLVQSTTVELFQSRGIAVAPISALQGNPQQIAYFGLAGLVILSGTHANGSLTLSWSDGVFSLFTPPLAATSIGARDLLRELTNQLSGRIKNRLLSYTVALNIGVPSVLSGPALERQRPHRETEVVFQFRTLRGEVVVTLDLDIDPGTLTYSGSLQVAKEGDFIPF